MPYLDNLCENALDLSNGKLIVESNLPVGTFCQWLISAINDKQYVNLEFENLDVRIPELNYRTDCNNPRIESMTKNLFFLLRVLTKCG